MICDINLLIIQKPDPLIHVDHYIWLKIYVHGSKDFSKIYATLTISLKYVLVGYMRYHQLIRGI